MGWCWWKGASVYWHGLVGYVKGRTALFVIIWLGLARFSYQLFLVKVMSPILFWHDHCEQPATPSANMPSQIAVDCKSVHLWLREPGFTRQGTMITWIRISDENSKSFRYRKPGLLWTWGLLWTDFVKMLSDALKYFKHIILYQLIRIIKSSSLEICHKLVVRVFLYPGLQGSQGIHGAFLLRLSVFPWNSK